MSCVPVCLCLESVGQKALEENDILFCYCNHIIEFRFHRDTNLCIFIDEESKPIEVTYLALYQVSLRIRNSSQDLMYLSVVLPHLPFTVNLYSYYFGVLLILSIQNESLKNVVCFTHLVVFLLLQGVSTIVFFFSF